MKYLFLFSALLFFFVTNILSANNSIVFVDMDSVISVSKPGSNILKQLTDLKNKNLKFFDKTEKNLKTKEEKIIKQKNILSENDFKLKVSELKSEIKQYNEDRTNRIKNYNEIKSANTKKLIELINPIIQKYSKNESISMILQKQNLIIGKSELDITMKIIELVNKNIKEFKIQ